MRNVLFWIFVFSISLEIFVLIALPRLSEIDIQSFKNFLQRPAFVDVLNSSGIKKQGNFRGAAWTDFNNDGYLDLLLVGGEVRLYKSKGNGTFTDVTINAFGEIPKGFISGFFADYDNDGCKDLFLVSYGPEISSRLYHNNCKGKFTDITKESGIKNYNYGGFGAAWGDFDNDGYLDIYIANGGNYSRTKDRKIKDYIYQLNYLYHNNGNGTFTEVSEKAGVSGKTNCRFPIKGDVPKNWSYKFSLQPIWFDYDNDGKLDLFIATDGGISPLYKNNGNGTFTEVTKDAGLCKGGTNMGVTVGDFDNDGNMDIYVTNVGSNYLWHNNGNGTFSEEGGEKGVTDPRTIGWGAGFFDFNNDGFLDLYSVNGSVFNRLDLHIPNDPDVGKITLDKLYRNSGKGTFLEESKNNGISGNYEKSAVGFGDYNNDGFVDLIVLPSYSSINDSRIKLYKNQRNSNHWITLKLKGVKSNKDGIGARITLRSGEKTQLREVIAGSSFISANSLWQTIGLEKSSTVESIEINWPSGIKQILKNVKSDQNLTIIEKL